MLKKLLFIVLTFCYLNSFSQSKNTDEIVSEGTSKIKVRPDIALFTLTVEKMDSIEKNVIRSVNQEINELVKVLYKVGFTDKTIKISDYEISSSRNDDDKKNYTASNALILEFSLDTRLIDALYKEIQEAELKDLDVSFQTKLSNNLEKATRLKLVQQAIEDAKINANNIAKTLGVKLVGVKQVSKYVGEIIAGTGVHNAIMYTPSKVLRLEEVKSASSFQKFQVEDLELEEKITIVYEISN